MTGVNESIQPTPIFPLPEVALVSQGAEISTVNDNKWRDRILGGLLLVAAGTSLLFQQSPGNEGLRANVGLDVLKMTRNAFAVGGAVTAITFGIEMGSSSLIAAGLNSRLKSLQRFSGWVQSKRFKNNSKTTKSIASDKITDMGIALGIGAGLVTAKHHFQDTEPTLRKDLITGAKASTLVAGYSGGVAVLMAGGISKAKNIGLGTPAEYFVKYGSDWKYCFGVVGIVMGGVWVKNKIMHRGPQEETTQQHTNQDESTEINIDNARVVLGGEQL